MIRRSARAVQSRFSVPLFIEMAAPDDTGSHVIETTLPTGHSYRSRAPAVATVRQAAIPPLHIDYVLAG